MSCNEEDQVTSLTKGCFLFKPNKNKASPKKKPKRSLPTKTHCTSESYFSSFPKESNKERSQRHQIYLDCWENLEVKINKVQEVLHEKIFFDLLEFIRNSHSPDKTKNYPINEIPTAALVTGVNLPDHDVVFTQFASKLRRSLTPYVAQINSKHCSNLKSMMKTCFDLIIKTASKQGEIREDEETQLDSDDDALQEENRKTKNKVFKEYTFAELQHWYQAQTELNISDIVKNDVMQIVVSSDEELDLFSGSPPLVIILEDYERFSVNVLQDFILICNEYTNVLPITFIFGIATSVTAVHRSLPPSVSSRLSIEKFQALPSLVSLTEVIDKILITDSNAFKLGPHVFRLLYEHFLYHDFSISNFVRGLKLSVMEHFYNNQFTILCTKDDFVIDQYISSLDSSKIENFKVLESFSRFIEKKSETEQWKIKNDKQHAKTIILELLQDLHMKEALFYPVVKCCHKLTEKLPGHPLGKRLRDTYEYCTISVNITKDKKYEHALSLVRMMSRGELLPVLKTCLDILSAAVAESDDDLEFNHDVDQLQTFIGKFDDLDSLLSQEESSQNATETPKTKSVFKTRYEFQEKLKQAVKEKKKESPYEKLRNEIVDVFDSMFKKYLSSPLSFPLHEIFYYDDMKTIQKRMNGAPRVALQKGLANPKSYLECTCCPDSVAIIQDTHPDISILYKLHLECGKLINLYDWLQAFITVIDPSLSDDKKKKSVAKKKLEEQLQARFIRGVSELQFLGFIKSTKRKTDHVARLTWGGC